MWPFDQLGWGQPEQDALNGLPPGQQFVVAGPKGEKFAAVSTGKGIQVSQQPIVAGADSTATPKTVVSKYGDGSVHVVHVDGDSITDTPLTAADPALAAKDDAQTKLDLARAGQIDSPEAVAKTVAQTNQYNARADQIAAMAAVNPALAQARTDRLYQQIANDSALTPARIASLQATATAKLSTVGLNTAKAGQATAAAGKLDAQTEVILQGAFAGLQQKYAQIDSLVGKPGGPATQAEADALKKQAFDQAAMTTASGMTANQRATNATTQRGQDITQGDNRATQATSIFDNAQSTGMDIAKGGGSAADIGKYLQGALGMAPNFLSQMGGAPLPTSGGAQGSGAFTPQHFTSLIDLVKSGTVPPDANGNVVPNAVKMMAGTGPQDNTLNTDLPSNANDGSNFLAGAAANPANGQPGQYVGGL